MVNVLITGSRKISNPQLVYNILNKEVKEGDVLIHGGATGVDGIAGMWAGQNNICVTVIRPAKTTPQYYLHRNAEMIGMCERVIAFWDGESRGTKFTIDYAKKRKLDVQVFKIE